MLRQLRLFASSFVGGIVIILLALTFVPAGTQQQGNQANLGSSVITIAGERFYDINVQPVVNNVLARNASLIEGEPRNLEEARALPGWARVENIIISSLALQPMLDAELTNQGWTASEEEVIAAIPNDPQFQVGGEYQRAFAATALDSPEAQASYIELRRRQINADRLLDFAANYAPAFTPSSAAQAQFDRATRLFGFDTVSLNANNEEVDDPTDAQLQALMDENPDNYQTQEFRDFSTIYVDPIQFEETIQYEAYLSEVVAQEQTVTYDLVAGLDWTDQDAQAVIDRVNAGETLAAVAEELLSGEPTRQTHSKATIPQALQSVIFSDNPEAGLLQNPVTISIGAAVVEIVDVSDGVLSREQYLAQNPVSTASTQAIDQAKALATLMQDTQQNGVDIPDSLDVRDATLEDLAEVSGIEPRDFDNVDRFGRYESTSGAPLVRDDPSFLPDLFAIEAAGDISEVRAQDNGTAFVIQLKSVTPSRAMTFEEARIRLESLWRYNQRNDALAARLEAPLEQLTAGELDLSTFAADQDVEVVAEELSPFAALAQLNIDPLEASTMAIGDVGSRTIGARTIVYQLREFGQQSAEDAEISFEDIQEQIAASFTNQLNQGLQQSIEAQADIDINEREWQATLDTAIQTAFNAGYFDGTATQASIQRALSQAQASASASATANSHGG